MEKFFFQIWHIFDEKTIFGDKKFSKFFGHFLLLKIFLKQFFNVENSDKNFSHFSVQKKISSKIVFEQSMTNF